MRVGGPTEPYVAGKPYFHYGRHNRACSVDLAVVVATAQRHVYADAAKLSSPVCIEDYVHELDDCSVLCKVDEQLVCKWSRLSISGDPHNLGTRLKLHVKSMRHLSLKTIRTE